MSKDTLNTILVACGIVPLKTPGMATALVEHFNPTDTAATFVDEVSNFAKAKTSQPKATHAAAAKKVLRELASEFSDRDDEYCHPRRMKNTWQRNGWKREVLRGRSELTGLDSAQSTSRQPAIMGFHNATGMCKTHSLLEAGSLLGAKKKLYITYNLVQGVDTDNPRVSILLRILLAFFNVDNEASGLCLYENKLAFTRKKLKLADLRKFAVQVLLAPKSRGRLHQRTDIFIELMSCASWAQIRLFGV